MGCYSFLVRLFHPLLYAGLSPRYPGRKSRPTGVGVMPRRNGPEEVLFLYTVTPDGRKGEARFHQASCFLMLKKIV